MSTHDAPLTAFADGADAQPEPTTDPEPEETDTPGRHESYHNGRCVAVASDGTRCSADSQMSAAVCASHDRDGQVTIESEPVAIIEAASEVAYSDLPLSVRDAYLDIVRAQGGGRHE